MERHAAVEDCRLTEVPDGYLLLLTPALITLETMDEDLPYCLKFYVQALRCKCLVCIDLPIHRFRADCFCL